MIPLPSRLPWLFVYPCQRQNPSRSTNRISKAFCWCHGEFGPSTRSVSVPNQIQTQQNTSCMENNFYETNQNIWFSWGSQTCQVFIYCEQTTERNQATNYITTIPYDLSRQTWRSRSTTKKMVVESLWCEMDPPGIFQHTYQVLTKKIQKRFGQKEQRCAWCIYLYYTISCIVAYDPKGFSS